MNRVITILKELAEVIKPSVLSKQQKPILKQQQFSD